MGKCLVSNIKKANLKYAMLQKQGKFQLVAQALGALPADLRDSVPYK